MREYWLSTSGSVPVAHDAAGHSPNPEHASKAFVIESPRAAIEFGTGDVVGVASSSTIVPVPAARVIDIPAGSDAAEMVRVSVWSDSRPVSGQTGMLTFFNTGVVPRDRKSVV